ncbi:MAG: sensor domain-containing diguanylate cyclase [Peptococcaceae bacterium]|jgi:diguanylate cyclase (GGDEF)-like protein|nr:sensor domain-containing diguanylate cyclase [Peptococcaceae bacterium]
MNTIELETIKKLQIAVSKLLIGEIVEPLVLQDVRDDGEEEEALLAFVNKFNVLVENINEIYIFAQELSKANLDAAPPARKNYLASAIKDLHAQFLAISWNMEQLVAGNMTAKMPYPGRLYTVYNELVDKFADYARQVKDIEYRVQDTALPLNRRQYQHVLAALNNMRVMVLEVDSQGEILFANRMAKNYLGDIANLQYNAQDNDVLLRSLKSLFTTEDQLFPFSQEVCDNRRNTWYKITADRMQLLDGQFGYMYLVDNISEWKQKETKLQRTAFTDALTGLNNRWVGMTALRDALVEAENGPYCAAFIDVDNLKMINDAYGHNEGDETLRLISNILRNSIRSQDIVCRYGGDEFLIVFCFCTHIEAEKIIQRMQDGLSHYQKKRPKPYDIGFSYGLVNLQRGKGQTIAELLTDMDRLMYEQKRQKI